MTTPSNFTIAKQSLYIATSTNDLDPHQVAVDRDLQSLFRVAQKKIDGSRLTSLSNISSTAGVIPAANLPTLGKFKIGSNISRDISLTSDLGITGVGFPPKAVICMMGDQSSLGHASWGYATTAGNDDCGIRFAQPSMINGGTGALAQFADGANNNNVTVKTWGTDGITLQFSKTNSPTSTVYFQMLFFG